MSRYWLLAIGGGAASVLMHSLAVVAPGGLLLANFAALPLYLVGLGLGLTAAATGHRPEFGDLYLPSIQTTVHGLK